MDSLIIIISPTILLFAIIVIGYLIGGIRIYNISLDLAAILIVAVASGFFIARLNPQIVDYDFENGFSIFSKLGTALFISAIGFGSGRDIAQGFNKKNLVCIFIGILMSVVGIATMKIIGLIDSDLDYSLLLGILCGALTSTPGLSAVCEDVDIVPELATLGYGCTYLFGVIGVVLFVQFMTRNLTIDVAEHKTADKTETQSIEILIPLAIAIATGSILGSITIPLLCFSLGTSGGILCMSVLIGFVIKKAIPNHNASSLSNYRSLGLMLFFVGAGVPAGIRLTTAFNIKWFIYGIILTTIPILCGYVLSRYLFKMPLADNMCIIAGGMTSTPAIGVLIRRFNCSLNLTTYSFTYIGALLALVLLI